MTRRIKSEDHKYVTEACMAQLEVNNPPVYEMLKTYGSISRPRRCVVLLGAHDELVMLSDEEAKDNFDIYNSAYTMKDGRHMPETIEATESVEEWAPTPDGGAGWYEVISKGAGAAPEFALFVPLEDKPILINEFDEQYYVNYKGNRHGKGDFIICPANPDGTPNLNKKRLVNGLVFADIFETAGWEDCLADNCKNKQPKNRLSEMPNFWIDNADN